MRKKVLLNQKYKRGKEKIKEFVCPECGGTVYGTFENFNDCPNCEDRLIVLNDEFSSMIISSPNALEFLKLFDEVTNSHIIFDRRRGERRKQKVAIPESTRVSDRRKDNGLTLGWISVKKKNKS